MRRKRIYILLALLVSVLLVAGYYWVRSVTGYYISHGAVSRIERGMTADAAKKVVGWSPTAEAPQGMRPDGKPHAVGLHWLGTNGALYVRADSEGIVQWVEFTSKPDAVWIRVWNKLGLPHL